MTSLGLAQETASTGIDHPRFRVGIATALSFAALMALIFDALFGSLAALLFLASGGLLLVTRPARSLQAVLRFRYLLILPLFCLLTVLWSQFPSQSLRYSIQLAITIVIAIAIASRISPTVFLRCLFGIYGLGVVGSVLFGRVRDDIGAWVGLFGSKNAFAAVVSAFALTAIAVLFDRTAPRVMRFAALAGVVAAGPLLLKAQSAGAIIFIVPAAATALAIILSRRLTAVQKLITAGAVATLAAAAFLVLVQFSEVLFQNLLDYSGKDVTLTGRTDLWDYAFSVIREHPLLGVGYQAFWVRGHPPAELLWAYFGIEARAGFNFHNTYINNAVEIGLVGLAIQVFILYGALLKTYLWAFRAPSPENAFLASFLTLIACSSYVEVAVFFQFSITTVTVICGYVYATQANARR
jgi:exopolysaccharide production protein ExoQ